MARLVARTLVKAQEVKKKIIFFPRSDQNTKILQKFMVPVSIILQIFFFGGKKSLFFCSFFKKKTKWN